MDRTRISFDRGTLQIDAPEPLAATLRGAVWDDRVGCWRAPAYVYSDVRARLDDLGIDVDDAIAATVRAPLALSMPALREYQTDALSAWRAHEGRGVVVLPTGAGKTRVAVAAMAMSKVSSLVLCPTRALLQQWYDELRRWYGGAVGVFGDGAREVERVTVMTFESGFRHLDRIAARFGLVVVDEAHHFATGLRAEALEMCPAPRRIGLTATAPRPETAGADRLGDLIGPVVYQMSLADLVGTHLAPAEFVRMRVHLGEEERRRYTADYDPFSTMYRALRRTRPEADAETLMRLLSRSPGGREALAGLSRAVALASFPQAKRRLAASLLERHRSDRTLVFTALASEACEVARELFVPVITAETSRRERTQILEWFREGRYRVIVSARVLNEGIDVPDARVAILLAGRLGLREHIQRIGRVLRPSPGKRALIYELVTVATIDDHRASARRRQLALGS